MFQKPKTHFIITNSTSTCTYERKFTSCRRTTLRVSRVYRRPSAYLFLARIPASSQLHILYCPGHAREVLEFTKIYHFVSITARDFFLSLYQVLIRRSGGPRRSRRVRTDVYFAPDRARSFDSPKASVTHWMRVRRRYG